ncbi:tripartite tricarboxylate transporter substrate binding protein [Ramlibacter sp. G-1-2-2]|uniref:Tripartite tricarboxylate transporter substrate binding protein n=1 Tax=Ramlibacter agri TaxID=2728837 RepID=A0A848GVY6_9BURK|nr:tripartite tricarboxylate transporter substrate binding protein [Ramlibacter agri]NML42287.1 tripartite tricarboxylate transporter substrate binding protein [Ramlibacter agri]
MNPSKRLVLGRAAAAFAGLTLAGLSFAQSLPGRPVTLMVPYPAGGVSDVIARTISSTLSKQLGQTVIVDNLGGASGGIAAQKVLSAPADGHMVFQGSPNELVLAPMSNAALKYRSEDFRLVQMISINPLAVFARKDLPASNGDELLAYARKAAAEGKPMTYASVGAGSMYHLLGEHLSKLTGIPMTHVPYKGSAPALQDLMGGQVDIFITPYGTGQVAMIDQGKLKAVAVLSADRQQLLKNVPPLQDTPALKGFVFDTWAGYFVRKDTPEPVVQALHKALGEVANDPAIREALEAQAMVVPRPQPLPALARLYEDNAAKYRAIAKAMNLQPQ